MTLRSLLLARKSRWFDAFTAAGYAALLFFLGTIPIATLPAPKLIPADKFWHFLAFGGLAYLLFRAVHAFDVHVIRAALAGAAASSALGALLEFAQSFVPYRSVEFADWIADTLGALLALLVLTWAAKADSHSLGIEP